MAWTDIFAAFRWWLILMILGTAAVPFGYWFFQRLPDRGYAFSKMLGLLVVSYLFWLLGSLGFVANNLGGILAGLMGLIGLSFWFYRRAYRRGDGRLTAWLRAHWGYILTAEVAFALLFALWVWVRAQNPAITATEKPMEFAFLNSVSRTPQFPPLDPWLSGFAISYYYFGYVMVSVIARLAAVPEPIAFNLGIAWLVAGSGIGAFGLVYNLIAANRERVPDRRTLSRLALTFALIALVALPIAGNGEMLLEVLHGNNVGSADFWAWLDVNDINGPPQAQGRYENNANWWWWRASRVINEYHLSGRDEQGLDPIAEFPGFSFILGDMHPHVLALPFAFLSLGVALTWYLHSTERQAERREEMLGRPRALVETVGAERLLATAVILGGLSFLNTWDVLIHLFVVVGAFVLARWRDAGAFDWEHVTDGLILSVLLVVPAYFLYWPFYLGFSSQAGPPFLLPMLMWPTRLPQFLVIFGMPLLAIGCFVVTLFVRVDKRGWKAGLIAAVSLPLLLLVLMLLLSWIIATSPNGFGSVAALADELGIGLPPRASGSILGNVGWGFTAVAAIAPAVIVAKIRYAGLPLLLCTLVGLVVAIWHSLLNPNSGKRGASPKPALSHAPALPFTLLLVLTAALLTLGPEFVYLKDNFGQRLNTIFKFYYQAWIMWGVAALVGLSYLLRRARLVGAVATAGYGALLALALLFPYYGVQSRALEFRGPATAERRPPTLNGLAHLERFNPDEYNAILWLRRNAEGAPVVLETTGDAYSSYARVSANTGLPTVLGWANHEYQWRGDSTDEPGKRSEIVAEMFDSIDWSRTADLLNRYGVQYIFVGSLERSDHDPQGLEKFSENLEVAYQNESVTIYRWQPQ